MNINESKVSEYIEAEKELKELKDKYKQAKDSVYKEIHSLEFSQEWEKIQKECEKLAKPYTTISNITYDEDGHADWDEEVDEEHLFRDHPEIKELRSKQKEIEKEWEEKRAELDIKYSIKELEAQIKAKEEELKNLSDASKKEIEKDDKIPEQVFKDLKDNYLDSSWETKVKTAISDGFIFAELNIIEKDVDITDLDDFWDEDGDFHAGSLVEDFTEEVSACLTDYIKDKDFKEGEQKGSCMWYHIPDTSWWICNEVDEGELIGDEPTASFKYTPATYWQPEDLDVSYSREAVDFYTTIYLRKKVEN